VITRGARAATSSADPYAWGSNAFGTLGTGDPTVSSGPTPFHIASIATAVKAVASGWDADHALAIGTDGSLWGWGDNTSSEISNTSTSTYYAPVQVPNMSGVTAAAAGFGYTLALKSDGTLWAWGTNQYGQLGIGTTISSATPTQVSFPAGVTIKAISAGGLHSLAVDSTGAVWAWGYGGFGALGNNSTTNSSTPVQVTAPANTTFTAVAAGQMFSLGLTSSGTVYAWGTGNSGELGLGGPTSAPTPQQVSLSGVSSIAAGAQFGVALTSSGSVYAWGDNTDGEIGTGSSGGSAPSPSQVTGLSGVTATAVAAGDNHALALASNGSVYAWGLNDHGQAGANCSTGTCGSPVQVPGVPSAAGVAAGTQFSLALVPTAPIATLSATSLSFGNQAQGTQSAAQTVTVTNSGGGTLSFNGITISGANASDYALNDGCSAQPVAPSSACTLSVTFAPGAIGASSATLTIKDNDPTGTQSVALSGIGTYSWSGVQSANGASTFRAGSKVGLQFQLTGASAGTTTATASAFETLVTNGTPGTYTATTGSPPNTGNSFSYSSHSNGYTYTWSTKGLSAGTYSVKVVLDDGTTGYITITLQ
jgi:alpha-tubulin suppressor-like RCC1 family protein